MAARKPRKTTARRTTATAKIRVHTDEYGRKVYSIVGTKKFAYTLAKAKEIASKSKAGKKRASTKKSTALTTTRKRKATRRTTGAKRNAKGQFVKAGRKATSRRTTRRNGDPSMATIRTQRLTERILSDAEYEVYSSLSKPGVSITKGQIALVEGRKAGLEVAEGFLDAYGLTRDVYREDNPRTGSIIFRGKAGSGVKGLLEISDTNSAEIEQGYVDALARVARRVHGRAGAMRSRVRTERQLAEGKSAAGTLLFRNRR